MRDYQRKKSKYILPAAVYHRAMWLIRDYYRLKEMMDDLIQISHEYTGKGSDHSDSTLSAVIRREKYYQEIKAVEDAVSSIPEEYKEGVLSNIIYRKKFPFNAHRGTYGRYKSKLIYLVAKNMFWI